MTKCRLSGSFYLFREKTASMDLYFEKHKVNLSLRIRVRNYYEFLYEYLLNKPDKKYLFRILSKKMSKDISNYL